jgi:diaminohydroxyphosphoribosylaminopyrimidine deaminase/5-amino-6-(5-phosphoribosylamino)uracil reductase
VLVEGGAQLLGSLFDAGQIDEVHAFIAPKLVGGSGAPSPVGGEGKRLMAEAASLFDVAIEQVGPDAYVHGRLRR